MDPSGQGKSPFAAQQVTNHASLLRRTKPGLILCGFLTQAEQVIVQTGALLCPGAAPGLKQRFSAVARELNTPLPLLLIFCSVNTLFSAKQVPVMSAVPCHLPKRLAILVRAGLSSTTQPGSKLRNQRSATRKLHITQWEETSLLVFSYLF